MTTPSFSFTLQVDPGPASPAAAGTANTAAGVPRPVVRRALRRPFQRDGQGGFARVSGSDAVLNEKVGNLLVLNGFPWDPGRSSRLDGLRHMNGNAARAFAQAFVGDAIRTYLPEVMLDRLTVENDGATMTVTVETSRVRGPDTVLTSSAEFRR